MPHPTTVAEKAKEPRRKVLTMIHKAGTSHIASNFSVIDIATVLYENLKPHDEVVWSKGWASATIYYFLAQQGKIPQEDLEEFPNAPYLGLAETTVPGVLCNGGAVGHGAPIAVGVALGKKRARAIGTVYCIMSDGELNEGSTWEAVMMAAHHRLNNLVFVIDANKWQAMGKTTDVCDIDAFEAFEGFGWIADDVDGHDHQDIARELSSSANRPRMMLCHTIKGKGVSFMEDHLLYHYKNVDDETYQKAMAELV
jgi:transketolase